MKAEIDENGGLAIIAESPTEAFALKCWWSSVKVIESPYTIRIVTDEDEYKEDA